MVSTNPRPGAKLGGFGTGNPLNMAEDETKREAYEIAVVTGNPALGESALQVGCVRLTAAPSVENPETSEVMAMVGVPCRFASSDVMSLLTPWRTHVVHVTVCRHCDSSGIVVLVECDEKNTAEELYANLHGRPFNSFESDRCCCGFVSAVEWETERQPQETCVVCLEKLDESLLTTACDHTFHMACLARWPDAPCPVCRYDLVGSEELNTTCDDCGTSDPPLWVCLLCGHCGCENEHARAHFDATSHAYALDVATRCVWDFAGEGYVHRLALGTDDDGKKVEEVPTVRGVQTTRDLEHRKLEGLAVEYSELLRSQLARQRDIYEDRLAALADTAAQNRSDPSLRRHMAGLDAKRAKLKTQLGKLQADLDFERHLHGALHADLAEWRHQATKANADLHDTQAELDKRLSDLHAQLETLMANLDSS